MKWAMRSWALAAGAAALVSAQASYASPPPVSRSVDPLVSLSLFGTAQSRAAVCGTGAACALPASGTTVAAASPMAGSVAAAAQDPRRERKGNQFLLLAGIIGLMIAIAVAATLFSGNEDGPVSPD